MTSTKQKLQILQRLNESEFRTEVLIPLLKLMGCEKVRERHGPQEYGKDITFCEPSALETMHYAIVAKIGDISGAASGTDNLATVQNQVKMAVNIPFDDIEDKQTHRINRVLVWTTGKISSNAQKLIMSSVNNDFANVGFRDGSATVDLLEKYYPKFFTFRDPYVSEYYSGVRETYSRIEELRTLGCLSENRRLPTIFVPPTLVPVQNPAKQKKLLANPTLFQKSTYSFEKMLGATNNMIIVGSAGSGKSVLLRRILLQTIELNEESQRRSPIPIFIELRKLDLGDPSGLEKALNFEFSRFDSKGLAQELGMDFADGSVLVLLDGLDELKTEERIKVALHQVRGFSQKYPNNRIILSSRMLDILEKPGVLGGFRVLQLSELTPEQMTKFVQNWFGKDSTIGKRLIEFVNQPSSLRGLPATPLTLALVASLYEAGSKEIPANLTDLFSRYIELALGRWDTGRDIKLQFAWDVKKFILQKIAWDMQIQHKSNIAAEDFQMAVRTISSDRGLAVDVSAYTTEVIERSELLFKTDSEFEFKHRALHEYFIGSELSDLSDSTELIVEHFLDPWWATSIFFACGLSPKSDKHLRAILDDVQVSGADLVTYAVCLGQITQATYLAPKQIKSKAIAQVVDKLIDAWDYLCVRMEQSSKTSEPESQFLSHIFFTLVHSAIAQASLGSITLSSSLAEIVEQQLKNSSVQMSPRDKARREWSLFLLATACAVSDNVHDFVRVFDSGEITDLSFLFVGASLANYLETREWLSPELRSAAHKLSNKLSKKLKSQKKHVASLMEARPQGLP